MNHFKCGRKCEKVNLKTYFNQNSHINRLNDGNSYNISILSFSWFSAKKFAGRNGQLKHNKQVLNNILHLQVYKQLSLFQIRREYREDALINRVIRSNSSSSLTSRSFLTSQTFLLFTGVPSMLKWAPPGSTSVGVLLIMICKRQIYVSCSKVASRWIPCSLKEPCLPAESELHNL